MSEDDYARDEAISMLQYEAVMENAARAQCIYLFVEGDSEEHAFPILLDSAGIDLEQLGIVIANYNGIGNLKHALRLLRQTLSHDRPLVLTFDNDEEGRRFLGSKAARNLDRDLVTVLPIPNQPIVRYPSGHEGGSFEEAFDSSQFIATCFSEGIMDDPLISRRAEFDEVFDPAIPWHSQVARFCHERGNGEFTSRKVDLAIKLAECSAPVPKVFVHLAEKLRHIRQQNPVEHPDDVELPRIPGLTC